MDDVKQIKQTNRETINNSQTLARVKEAKKKINMTGTYTEENPQAARWSRVLVVEELGVVEKSADSTNVLLFVHFLVQNIPLSNNPIFSVRAEVTWKQNMRSYWLPWTWRHSSPLPIFRPFLAFLKRFEKFVELSQAVLLVSLTEKTWRAETKDSVTLSAWRRCFSCLISYFG